MPESLQSTAPGLGNYFPLGDYLRDGLRALARAVEAALGTAATTEAVEEPAPLRPRIVRSA